jgi:tetratricopeptide (TPR) repeat protein
VLDAPEIRHDMMLITRRAVLLIGLAALLTAPFSAMGGCQLRWLRTPAARSPAPAAMVSERQEQFLEDAQRAMAGGDYEVALSLFRELLAENPTITTAYLGIGQIHMERQDYTRAEPAYARAARLEPRNFDAQYGHGLALQMLGRLVEAVRAYHRALTIQPEHPKANLNIATTYLQMEQPRNAVVFAEKAVDVDPANGAARANLGAVYEQLGRSSDAIEHYLIAMELIEGDTTPLMMNLINVLGREQRYREAVNTAEHLVRIAPDANAYERLGWGYFRLGEYDRSIEAYRRATELDDRHWPSWTGVGVNALNTWLLSERQDEASFREARNAFRRSLQTNPDQPRLVTLMSNYGL